MHIKEFAAISVKLVDCDKVGQWTCSQFLS